MAVSAVALRAVIGKREGWRSGISGFLGGVFGYVDVSCLVLLFLFDGFVWVCLLIEWLEVNLGSFEDDLSFAILLSGPLH